jgi:hypothetical protein
MKPQQVELPKRVSGAWVLPISPVELLELACYLCWVLHNKLVKLMLSKIIRHNKYPQLCVN